MIPEMNIETKEDKAAILDKLRDAFVAYRQDELDGLTVWLDDGWFNLRASNTEPVLRLNAEAKTQDQLDKIVTRVTSLIAG
jgi:phosphomannomutase